MVKSSSGRIAEKTTSSMASRSMTSLKSGIRLASRRIREASRAMSSSIVWRTPGRWILTTAGRPDFRTA
jgi:hypothetical protein